MKEENSTTDQRNKANKPNIILMIIDDLGYADMGFQPFAPKDITDMGTPSIDAIKASGTYFDNAYATAPICSPARTGLITGRYQQRWGNYWFGQGGLNQDEFTLPQALKELGYHTAKIGKTHHNGGDAEDPRRHGFDKFFGFIDHTHDYIRLSQEDVDAYGKDNAWKAHLGPMIRDDEDGSRLESYSNYYTTDLFTDEALKYIEEDKDAPFFMEVSYNAVHHPTYVGHPDYLKQFGLDQFPFWDPHVESYDEWHLKWGHLGEVDPDGRTRYLATLKCLDDNIGRILDKLEEQGKRDDTMIIFLSDNGGTINTYADNGPLGGYKYTMEEGGLRIPMILSYPAMFSPNEEVSAVVSAMDIFPTIMSAIGGEIKDNIDGKDLSPLLVSKRAHHESLVWDSGNGDFAVRQSQWKLLQLGKGSHFNDFDIKDGVCVRSEAYEKASGLYLYNLIEDIGEEKDLSSQHPEIVEELMTIYTKWRSEMADPTREQVRGDYMNPPMKQ